MEDRTTALNERISFAEDWLGRAKRQIADGNLEHGTLTLILAEAELHRAREVGLRPALRLSRARPRALSAVAVGVVAAAVALTAGWQASRVPPRTDAGAAPVPIVTLPGAVGDMLRMVNTPEAPVERTVVKSLIVRVPVTTVVHRVVHKVERVPVPSVAPPGAPHVALQTPAPVTAPVPAPPSPAAAPAAQPPALLSDADVIDLVLAAERSLRQPAKQ
jgi:hypothetical protein